MLYTYLKKCMHTFDADFILNIYIYIYIYIYYIYIIVIVPNVCQWTAKTMPLSDCVDVRRYLFDAPRQMCGLVLHYSDVPGAPF